MTQTLIFPKFSDDTNKCDKVSRRTNIYYEKCTQSTFSMPKAIT